MRTIGFVGLGKLGLPVALAIESRGFQVVGFDPDPRVERTLRTRRLDRIEEGAQDLLLRSKIRLVTPLELARDSDLVFVAVQTPHLPRFEGTTPLPEDRADFDYSYLRDAIDNLAICAASRGEWIDPDKGERYWTGRPLPVAIISTCLPGTFRLEVMPRIEGRPQVDVAYNPAFIAMGTTVKDFLEPEFVLVGYDGERWMRHNVAFALGRFYEQIHSRPLIETDVTSAELAKVAYNTFIGQKIVFANAVMELAHKLGADCDDVAQALELATQRVVSPAYMRGGMGDGGACHPRDNIALSWLAREVDLSYDLFGDVMLARENQTRWIARLAVEAADAIDGHIVLLGKAYKPGSDLTYGSPALLLQSILEEEAPGRVWDHYDPLVDRESGPPLSGPAVFVIATRHDAFACYDYPEGSVVVDPFRYVVDKPGVEVLRIGERPR